MKNEYSVIVYNTFCFFRIFSREGIIVFQTPSPQLEPKERRRCESELRKATKEGSKGFLEVLGSVERFFSQEGQELLDDEISPRICSIFDSLLRSQANYEKLAWFTFDVSFFACFINFCFPMTGVQHLQHL